MRTALLVIDMQQGCFPTPTARHDTEGVVGRINALASRVRAAGGLVLHIQHDGPPGDAFHPGEPGWQFLPDLKPTQDDLVVHKTSCDAFLNTSLDDVLKQNGVNRVIVTGCATDYCVDTTIRSALARGYPTTVPADGHTTADRPYLPAQKIIEHHNFVWSDFISPAGPARVIPCAEIELSA